MWILLLLIGLGVGISAIGEGWIEKSNEPEMMRSCIEADMEWIDGDCVKPQRKGDE